MSGWDKFIEEFITRGAYKNVLNGLLVTVEIAVFGLLIGILVGTLIAIVKVIPKKGFFSKFLDKICVIYVGFFRGTPMAVQLLMTYYVIFPLMGVVVNTTIEAIIIFGLNSGAYVSEIMRAGINSVDKGQMEAGRALGLTFGKTMMKIIIPQSVKNILPTLGNEFIVLIKETAIVSLIPLVDLTKAFKDIGATSYSYLIAYLILALVYLVIVMIIAQGIKYMERRFNRNER